MLTFKPMTQGIRLEVSYLEKSQSLIINQLNFEWLTWKKNINYTKGSKIKNDNYKNNDQNWNTK
jgi:hypothetical protein